MSTPIITYETARLQEEERQHPTVCPTCGLAVRDLMDHVAEQFATYGRAYMADIQLLRSHFRLCKKEKV
jgi:hypothetical protein